VADVGAGSFGAVTGILAAVIHRTQTGEGQFVDISMFDGAVAWNSLAASHYLVAGQEAERESLTLNGGSFYDFYRTADGRHLSVGSLEPKFWAGSCQAIGCPHLAHHSLEADLPTQQQVKAQIQAVIATRPLADWLTIFAGVDVCVEPVLTSAEMVNHPQTQARQMIVEVPKGDGTHQRQVGSPFKFSASQPVYKHTGPALGQHAGEVLAEIGYSEEEISQFRAAGIFG
jgi:crotonobetainyl-CoA:carnitine CoA-transferase CaiB-like acyl-CoA transferase